MREFPEDIKATPFFNLIDRYSVIRNSRLAVYLLGEDESWCFKCIRIILARLINDDSPLPLGILCFSSVPGNN